MTKGRIHSCESFGTVDGPGIRFVIFMQGCPMRCIYCHNPDTWSMNGGKDVSAEALLAEYRKNETFYKNGGITVSGGEPLLQIDFLIELFEGAKRRGIHTCIDTSGVTYNGEDTEYGKKLVRLMDFTDLVMLDIKHNDDETHKRMTGRSNKNILEFARFLAKHNVPLWVRRVVVKGYTDGREENLALGRFLATLPNLKAIDVLPYHSLGESKYKELGIDYPLAGMPPMSRDELPRIRREILEEMGRK